MQNAISKRLSNVTRDALQVTRNQPVAYSNRAMAHLKTKEWAKAERDAMSAIELDPWHVKLYQRCSAARISLGKLCSALKDLHIAENAVLLQPSSEGTRGELKKEKNKVERKLDEAVQRAPRQKIPVDFVESKRYLTDGAAT